MKKACSPLLVFVVCFLLGAPAAAGAVGPEPSTGEIKGRVIDAEVKAAVPGVRIEAMGTGAVAYTDDGGNFSLENIPVGHYVVQVSHEFYTPRSLPDVIVRPGRLTTLDIEIYLSADIREEEITVRAAFFDRGGHDTTGLSSFSNEEIRRAAGSAGDVSRIISGLPSVARTDDMVNALIVRGGSPDENAFYIDNIEIPNINHYPRLGTSIGSLGLLNVDFIREVNFFPGAFSPRYGHCLSSVMDIDFRNGNRDEYDFQFDLSMMGAGLVAEGPLAGKAGAWMVSARRSYIDLLIDLMGQGVPVSWSDFQGKITLDPAPGTRLTLLGVAGIDNSGTDVEDAIRDGESYYGGLDTIEYTAGLNWFQAWGGKGYSNTSLSVSSTRYDSDAFYTTSGKPARRGESTERFFACRNVTIFRFDRAHKLEFGFDVKHVHNDYSIFSAAAPDVMGNPVPEIRREAGISAGGSGLYLDHTWSPSSRLNIHLGLRGDYFALNGNTHLAPRVSIGWRISGKTSLDVAAGIYHQSLPPALQAQDDSFRHLRDPMSIHFVLGVRHLLSDDTRLSLEVYDKEYRRFPLDPAQPSLFIFDEVSYGGFLGEHADLTDNGTARSMGIEFLVQKKLAERIYGVVSAAWFRTRYRDVNGIWRNRVYDNRFIFALEGGFKPTKTFQFGWKWTWAGGLPYTPFDLNASSSAGQGIFDPGRINGERLAPYHSLNLRVDKRFHFASAGLTVYFSVWNVFNRRNPYGAYWNAMENRPDFSRGWGRLPVLGLELEF